MNEEPAADPLDQVIEAENKALEAVGTGAFGTARVYSGIALTATLLLGAQTLARSLDGLARAVTAKREPASDSCWLAHGVHRIADAFEEIVKMAKEERGGEG